MSGTISAMLSVEGPMERRDAFPELTLRPVESGEALFGFAHGNARASESDSQRPQVRYAPTDPQGVVLLGCGEGTRARLGVGLLKPVEGAHALVEVELCVGASDPERRFIYQERLLEALVVLAKATGARRMRLRMGLSELTRGPWIRCLQTQPSVHVIAGTATVEFPVAAYVSTPRSCGGPDGSGPHKGTREWGKAA